MNPGVQENKFVLFWDLLDSQEKPGRTEESKKTCHLIQGSPRPSSGVMPLNKGEVSKNALRPAWKSKDLLKKSSRRRKPRERGSRDR